MGVIAVDFNYVWKVLSIDHRNALRSRIKDVTRIFANEEMKTSIGIIQQKKEYKVARNIHRPVSDWSNKIHRRTRIGRGTGA